MTKFDRGLVVVAIFTSLWILWHVVYYAIAGFIIITVYDAGLL